MGRILKNCISPIANTLLLSVMYLLGKRKGRGGRKGPQSSADLPSDSPKRKDSRIEFQGLLSHASPPITNFFQPKSKDLPSSVVKEVLKGANLCETSDSLLEEHVAENGVPDEKSSSCEVESQDKNSVPSKSSAVRLHYL